MPCALRLLAMPIALYTPMTIAIPSMKPSTTNNTCCLMFTESSNRATLKMF